VTPPATCRNRHRTPALHGQRGAVLLFGLVVLAVMLIGSVALVRSVELSLFNAGNLGFKRDLGNQSERAAAAARDLLTSGALSTPAARESHARASNYSAAVLPSNEQGIPRALLDDAGFGLVGDAVNDIVVLENGVVVARIRWLLERLCRDQGPLLPSSCLRVDDDLPGSSATDLLNAENPSVGGPGAIAMSTYYRLSVRVVGARGTRGFFQSSYAL